MMNFPTERMYMYILRQPNSVFFVIHDASQLNICLSDDMLTHRETNSSLVAWNICT